MSFHCPGESDALSHMSSLFFTVMFKLPLTTRRCNEQHWHLLQLLPPPFHHLPMSAQHVFSNVLIPIISLPSP
ncbi:hypothetical protein PAXRUDRAFT_233047 [Paxillus rubicundulus Ve08.2h10]|uniref:Uncharacterized protein n=1 Tax=Paxillus rubicundulus Ve08.2h10 TaxID=930991 RepID=A0A0D0DGT3_9AGAM|nr:hypothetical protein PAXRUDRAFT_233047 [Paxillus rubicundulus Ve08.2h10]